MMKKILIWRKIIEGDGVDIFFNTNYFNIDNRIGEIYGGSYPNWGNKLWLQGIYSEIDVEENEIHFRTTETIDEINEKYDLIIYPMANFFGVEYVADMIPLAEMIKEVKIPMYIIACGVQAKSYDMLENLIDKIGTPASKFIEAVYHTGGEFALRGNFSKEFFERLGFPSAVVTGCPSMYQLGEGFCVNNKKVDEKDIKPLINGKLRNFEKIMQTISNSVYMDQDCYGPCLYRADYLKNFDLHSRVLFAYNYSCYQADLLGQDRIKMIADMNDWYQYIVAEGYNYSLGSRIHGNIMTILTGSPATVLASDTRTLEMAEFFDIPHAILKEKHRYGKEDLLKFYYEADFTRFNELYKSRYNKFQSFLIQNKIVSKMNDKNQFFNQHGRRMFEDYKPNQEAFKELATKLKREKSLMWIAEKLLEAKNEYCKK